MRIHVVVLVSLIAMSALTVCGRETPVAPQQKIDFAKVPGAEQGGRPLYAELVPTGNPPLAPGGSGTALITLNHGRGEICWHVTASNITQPSGLAHIHGPFPSVAVVFPFTGPDATGVTTGCTDGVDRELIKEILKAPELFFVNIHPATGGTDITGFLSK